MCAVIAEHLPGAGIFEISARESLVKLLSVAPRATVIINLSTFDFPDLDSFFRIVERFDHVQWALTFPELSHESTVRAIAAGMSVIYLDAGKEEFALALSTLQSGAQYICARASEAVSTSESGSKSEIPLTETEKEILRLIADGMSVKEIADKRCNSIHTIVTHKKNIFRKLDVNTAHEAIKYALRSGLVDPIDYYI